MDEVRARLREAPEGAARFAWSWLAALLALVVAGLTVAIGSAVAPAWCGAENPECSIGVLVLWAAAGMAAGAVVGAVAFRLGWAWWAVVAAGVLSVPLWWSWLPPLASGGVLLLLPGLAAAVTWPGVRHASVRDAVVASLAVAVVALTVWVVVGTSW